MAAAANIRPLLALVALLSLSLGVLGDCVSYGVDYANGGAYYIDGSSNQYFSFITVFQGETETCSSSHRELCWFGGRMLNLVV